MTSIDVTEYNTFGPWVHEVTEPDGVPRLYRDHPLDFSRAELVLKVPRNIARRDANPWMDLYDALVIVDHERTTLLSRHDHDYTTRSVQHGSLVAVADSVQLLDGRLVLHIDDGEPLLIAYNGSSREDIGKLVGLLRRLGGGASGGALSFVDPENASQVADPGIVLPGGERDYGLIGAWLDLTEREPALILAGAHPTTVLVPASGPVARLVHRVRPMMLHGAIVSVTSGEVHVVHRLKAMTRGSNADLSSGHTIILRRGGVRATSEPLGSYEELRAVRVTAGKASLRFVTPRSATSESALLRAIG